MRIFWYFDCVCFFLKSIIHIFEYPTKVNTMKKYLSQPIGFFCILILPFSTLNTSCDDFSVCDAIRLADLIIDAFSSNLNSSSGGELVYDFTTTVLNVSDSLVCNTKSNAADPNRLNERIEYKGPGMNSVWQVMCDTLVDINKLDADQGALVGSEYTFGQDGSYRIVSEADFNDDVEERNEDNNTEINSPGKRSERVIEVTGLGYDPRKSPVKLNKIEVRYY